MEENRRGLLHVTQADVLKPLATDDEDDTTLQENSPAVATSGTDLPTDQGVYAAKVWDCEGDEPPKYVFGTTTERRLG